MPFYYYTAAAAAAGAVEAIEQDEHHFDYKPKRKQTMKNEKQTPGVK